jgi:hypothetical protein
MKRDFGHRGTEVPIKTDLTTDNRADDRHRGTDKGSDIQQKAMNEGLLFDVG